MDKRLMIIPALAAILTVSPAGTQASAMNSREAKTETLTIQGSKGKLSAIMQTPDLSEGQTCPVVLLLHGFTGNKNGGIERYMADELQQRGIASIRFDFNGHGDSEGPFEEMTVPNEVEDLKQVFAYAKALPFAGKIALSGHSQGGVVASMGAGELPEGEVSAVVLMAPAAVLRDDAIRGNTMGAMYNPLDPPEHVELFGGIKLGRAYIESAFSLPIYETAAAYHGPACIIHGTGDRVVPYSYGERYHDLWPASELHILDGYDHGFGPDMTGACDIAVDFLSRTLAGGYVLPEPTRSLLLYPEGQTADKGIVENGKAVTLGPGQDNGLRGENAVNPADGNVYNIADGARIDIYLPEKGNGQMIVVCPGGGYEFCSGANEGTRVADWCLKQGIAVCVVIYRLPNGHSSVPLTDVQNAFRYCRAHASEWGIRQIGVMGFSAGGHLAATVSNLFVDEVTRPDFSVLIYPVITFEEFVTHPGTRYALIGREAGRDPVEFYSMENRVTADTPPTLLMLSDDDGLVVPENSLRYYRAMQAHGVKGEMHVFSRGGHGWGFSTVENSGYDGLGEQRADFFRILSRWLATQRGE